MLISNSKILNSPEFFINFNPPDAPQDQSLISKMTFINNSETPYAKFLGVLIDPNLSFKAHANMLNKRLSTALFFMRKAKNVLSEKSLKFIYYSLFHSHLVYANQLWSCCSESVLKPLIMKQKIAVRIISNSKYNSHTEPIFKRLNILPLKQLSEFFKLQFMQQFSQNFLPTALKDMWVTNRMRHIDEDHIVLRNDDLFFIPFARSSITSKLPLTSFPKLWCEFPDENIKFIRNKLEFNTSLKRYFIDKLRQNITCNRLLCPDCHLNI